MSPGCEVDVQNDAALSSEHAYVGFPSRSRYLEAFCKGWLAFPNFHIRISAVDYFTTNGVSSTARALSGPVPLDPGAGGALEDDASLAQALLAGQREAPGVAFRRYSPVVQSTLRRLLGPGEDIADLTQDVFARFFDKVVTLRALESLRSFIIGIAFRRAREEIRRRHVRRTLRPMVENHLRGYDDTWKPESRDEAIRLLSRLESLGLDGRIYALRIIEGLDLVEVSDAVGLSISTVRRRLARATKRVERWTRESTAVLSDEDDLDDSIEPAAA